MRVHSITQYSNTEQGLPSKGKRKKRPTVFPLFLLVLNQRCVLLSHKTTSAEKAPPIFYSKKHDGCTRQFWQFERASHLTTHQNDRKKPLKKDFPPSAGDATQSATSLGDTICFFIFAPTVTIQRKAQHIKE